MNNLNLEWNPEFGIIYTWVAMDQFGKLAVMVNNCFGDIPRILLKINDIDLILLNLSEFLWEESDKYKNYPLNKNGSFYIDLFSKWRNNNSSNEKLLGILKRDLIESKNYSEVNFPVNKGLYVYHGVEGAREGEDYPVGYSGKTKMGDYFRYLVPTVFADINDFPKELWPAIVVSDTLDF